AGGSRSSRPHDARAGSEQDLARARARVGARQRGGAAAIAALDVDELAAQLDDAADSQPVEHRAHAVVAGNDVPVRRVRLDVRSVDGPVLGAPVVEAVALADLDA